MCEHPPPPNFGVGRRLWQTFCHQTRPWALGTYTSCQAPLRGWIPGLTASGLLSCTPPRRSVFYRRRDGLRAVLGLNPAVVSSACRYRPSRGYLYCRATRLRVGPIICSCLPLPLSSGPTCGWVSSIIRACPALSGRLPPWSAVVGMFEVHRTRHRALGLGRTTVPHRARPRAS